jgi:transcription elongation factor Elf1
MSMFVDIKYLNMLSNRFLLFKQKHEFLWNFRCPICGDSQKKLTKARGYVHRKKNDLFYKCHNCGIGLTFSNFLKKIDINLHSEYIMERYRNGENGHSNYEKPTFKFKTPVFKSEKKLDIDLPCIFELDDNHPCKKYVSSRNINPSKYKYLYFAQNFKEWVESLNLDNSYELINNDPRLVIPFIDEQGNLIAAQGRSIDKKSKLRYITIKVKEDAPKIFGLNTLDRSKTIYVVEGPIDSLFVENSIAVAGADLSTSINFLNDSDLVFVYDNEKRNKEIIKKMEKNISQGQKIVIWPNNILYKDINDMILHDIDVMKILKENTFSGLQAKMKLVIFKV